MWLGELELSGVLPLCILDASLQEQAAQLAATLGTDVRLLPERRAGLEALIGQYPAVLVLDAHGLGLQALEKPLPGPVHVDFAGGTLGWRRQHGGGRGEMIAKACGVKKEATPRILDATAGLGRDALILASLGCELLLCERSPVVSALLRDGLQRAATVQELQAVMARMELLPGDALGVFRQLSETGRRPDVICLDPMFPHRQKSALVKKDMRIFREVVGEDMDADALLEPALALAQKRVVVKRPRHAPFLSGKKPDMDISGESSRFDIYLLQR